MPSRFRKQPTRRVPPEVTIATARRMLSETNRSGRINISARLLLDLIKLAATRVAAEEGKAMMGLTPYCAGAQNDGTRIARPTQEPDHD